MAKGRDDLTIVAFVGRMRAGKSTATDLLTGEHGYVEYAFAGPLKDGCGAMFGLTHAQLYGDHKEVKDTFWGATPRYILQRFGTEIGRELVAEKMPGLAPALNGDTLWIAAFRRWLSLQPPGVRVVVSDCRFEDELRALVDAGAVIIGVRRPECDARAAAAAAAGSVPHASERLPDHPLLNDPDSEIGDRFTWVDNDGTLEEFRGRVSGAVEALLSS